MFRRSEKERVRDDDLCSWENYRPPACRRPCRFAVPKAGSGVWLATIPPRLHGRTGGANGAQATGPSPTCPPAQPGGCPPSYKPQAPHQTRRHRQPPVPAPKARVPSTSPAGHGRDLQPCGPEKEARVDALFGRCSANRQALGSRGARQGWDSEPGRALPVKRKIPPLHLPLPYLPGVLLVGGKGR